MSPSSNLKQKVALANRILAYAGVASGVYSTMGHASARDPETGYFYMKGRGYEVDALHKMHSEDLLTLDLDAKIIEGPPGIYPAHEVKMHTQIYKARPDVMGVVHTHATTTVLLSMLNKPIVPMINDGSMVIADGVPVFKSNALISTDELGDKVAEKLKGGKVLLLRGHGAISVGKSVEEATMNMIYLEEQAKLNYQALASGVINYPHLKKTDVKAFRESLDLLKVLPWLKQGRIGQPKEAPERLWAIYVDLISEK